MAGGSVAGRKARMTAFSMRMNRWFRHFLIFEWKVFVSFLFAHGVELPADAEHHISPKVIIFIVGDHACTHTARYVFPLPEYIVGSYTDCERFVVKEGI